VFLRPQIARCSASTHPEAAGTNAVPRRGERRLARGHPASRPSDPDCCGISPKNDTLQTHPTRGRHARLPRIARFRPRNARVPLPPSPAWQTRPRFLQLGTAPAFSPVGSALSAFVSERSATAARADGLLRRQARSARVTAARSALPPGSASARASVLFPTPGKSEKMSSIGTPFPFNAQRLNRHHLIFGRSPVRAASIDGSSTRTSTCSTVI
jgi:hypothetical protein